MGHLRNLGLVLIEVIAVARELCALMAAITPLIERVEWYARVLVLEEEGEHDEVPTARERRTTR